jgi:hypothetical protein
MPPIGRFVMVNVRTDANLPGSRRADIAPGHIRIGPPMRQPEPGLTADATTAPAAHWRRLSSPTHHDPRRHGAEAQWDACPHGRRVHRVMASASASGGGVGPGVIRRMSETTTRDLGLRARRSGQPPPNHRAMPAPTSSPAMNTTAGGLTPRAHGQALAGSAASGIEASPVAAGHEVRRRQL